jgi:hypothetical protein
MDFQSYSHSDSDSLNTDEQYNKDNQKNIQSIHIKQLSIGISCMTYEIWMTCVCMDYKLVIGKILKLLKLVSILHNNNIPLHFYVNKFTLLNQLNKNLSDIITIKYGDYDKLCAELIQLHIVSYKLNVTFEAVNVQSVNTKRPLIKLYDVINYIIRNDQSNTYLNVFFNNLNTILILLTNL